ncbi:MAG TPA: outer membrane beta-barrel protein [Gammaproteobacteria bacterium]
MKLHTLVVAGAMLPLGAVAQDLDYTFVEAAYANSELDAGPIDVDGDGLELRGSVLITDTVFLLGEYLSYDYDQDVDLTGYSLGAGMRWNLKPELDLVGDIGWAWREWDRRLAPDIDDDGFQLGIGLRSRVHDDIEVQAGIRHFDLDDSDTYLTLGGRYYLTDNVAAGLGLRINDDDTGWSIGLRAEFGN